MRLPESHRNPQHFGDPWRGLQSGAGENQNSGLSWRDRPRAQQMSERRGRLRAGRFDLARAARHREKIAVIRYLAVLQGTGRMASNNRVEDAEIGTDRAAGLFHRMQPLCARDGRA